MILSRPDILSELEKGTLRFEPAVPEGHVAQVSIDLLLGRNFTTFKKPAYLPAIYVDPSLWDSADLWEQHEEDVFQLKPRGFVLAQTLEKVYMPAHLAGFVEGRSSWARLGITIHITAPKIDPGFQGRITLEMCNFGEVAVDLRAAVDLPAQLILMRVSTPLPNGDLYGAKPGDLFQHQVRPIPD